MMIDWFKNLFRKVKDERVWKESFKSYLDGNLHYVTYYCEKTREFKRVYPNEIEERPDKWWRPSFETRNNPDRIKYAKDLVQPFKPDGTVNPEYIKVYKRDPRTDQAHRNNPRNINNRYAVQNYQANEDFRKWERKKYGV